MTKTKHFFSTNLIAAFWLAALITVSMTGCTSNRSTGTGVTVHCDRCGKEVTTDNTNVDESWTLYCDNCAEELGLNDLIPKQ